jgi:hypothetical protein
MSRDTCHRIYAEEQLAAAEVELQQARDDLTIERGLTDCLKEQWRCRDCNVRWED